MNVQKILTLSSPEQGIFIFKCLNDGLEAGEHLGELPRVLYCRDVDLHLGAKKLDPGGRWGGGLVPPVHHRRGLGWCGSPGPRLVILLNTVSVEMRHINSYDEF